MKKSTGWIIALYAALISVSLAGVYVSNFSSLSIILLAVACFSAVISSALLISWGAECYQFVVSQGFAVAVIALLQVIPEFLVEGVIAWQKDIPLMMANFTGSNRLLMGLGWSGVYFIASTMHFLKKGTWLKEIRIKEVHSIEVVALLISSAYFCVILLKGTLTIIDSVVLLSIFVWYMWALLKLEPEEKEKEDDLIAPCKAIVKIKSPVLKNMFIYFLFIVGGITFLFVAEPFIHSLRGLSAALGISTFIFVQWVAPFLSEFPEKLTAFYWASRITHASLGLVNFVSSKVNQWTLLIAMVPIVYSVSMGQISAVPLDDHHKWQIFLSMVMTFYGCSCLAKFRFTFIDAVLMFSLWFIQFVMPGTLQLTSYAFITLTIINLYVYRKEDHLFKGFWKNYKKYVLGNNGGK